VSSGLHSAAAADDISRQVLALSRNTLPFKIRGGYCNSQVWPNPPPLYVIQSCLHQSVTVILWQLTVYNWSLSVTDGCSDLTQVMSSEVEWRSNTKLQTFRTHYIFCKPLVSLKKHFHHFQKITTTTWNVKCFLRSLKNRSFSYTAIQVFVSCYQQIIRQICWPLKMGPIGCPKTSLITNQLCIISKKSED
jgi:hypothetical protein